MLFPGVSDRSLWLSLLWFLFYLINKVDFVSLQIQKFTINKDFKCSFPVRRVESVEEVAVLHQRYTKLI